MRHLVAMVMRDVVVTRKQIHISQIYARRLTATDQMIKNPAVSTDMKITVMANVNTPKIRGTIRNAMVTKSNARNTKNNFNGNSRTDMRIRKSAMVTKMNITDLKRNQRDIKKKSSTRDIKVMGTTIPMMIIESIRIMFTL